MIGVALMIVIGWLLDMLSTFVGLQLGFQEGSPLFLLFPFMWMLMMVAAVYLIRYFKWAPMFLRKTLILGIVLYSFIPALHNLVVIWRILP